MGPRSTTTQRAVFRLPTSALFVPLLLFMVTAPLASASVWTVGLFAVPALALVWVLWTRTVADDQAITVHDHRGRRRIPWADLDGFLFNGQRWAVAQLYSGAQIRLPMVRPRDLPRLAAVSGGRLYLGPDAVARAESQANTDTAVVPNRAPATPPNTTGSGSAN